MAHWYILCLACGEVLVPWGGGTWYKEDIHSFCTTSFISIQSSNPSSKAPSRASSNPHNNQTNKRTKHRPCSLTHAPSPAREVSSLPSLALPPHLLSSSSSPVSRKDLLPKLPSGVHGGIEVSRIWLLESRRGPQRSIRRWRRV